MSVGDKRQIASKRSRRYVLALAAPVRGGLHYNSGVPPRLHPGNARRIYGLALIALLILLLTLLRFWERIPWSAR